MSNGRWAREQISDRCVIVSKGSRPGFAAPVVNGVFHIKLVERKDCQIACGLTQMSSMLQVPNSSIDVGSLPPSQTATLVGPMAAEIATNSQHEWDESSPQMTEAQPGSAISTVLPKVPITFLLGSGKRKTLDFEQSDTFGGIKECLTREWPTG
ncbi:hypothetical protein M408DRAFT_85016 [Serendipita vermifera MAFF 305830]|uniref:UBL3-like ubiquitin domain-containing protein n=1 Tax=Serendipita vermifera MAFF 305830 TaxID=933852 RepID=A0A0C3BAD9_SERVB|nr:hypothetical protein M408DRAFT_85016 [Serendipita vermifera MAFF 305830]